MTGRQRESLLEHLGHRRQERAVRQEFIRAVIADSAGLDRPAVRLLVQARMLASGETLSLSAERVDWLTDIVMTEGQPKP